MMEDGNIIIDGDYEYERVKKTVELYKPIGDRQKYVDILIYLVQALDRYTPGYRFILSMASYALQNNGLTKKQRRAIDEWINDYTRAGVL